MTFKFKRDSAGKVFVTIEKLHDASVIDRIDHEWCAFDDRVISIDKTTNYDFHIANEIIRLTKEYPSYAKTLTNLGNGILYNGNLEIDEKSSEKTCKIGLRHEMFVNDVVSYFTMTITNQDGTSTWDLGLAIDKNFKTPDGKVVQGDIENGIVIPSSNGKFMFILKDLNYGASNVNCVRVSMSDWQSNYNLNKEVGDITIDEKTNVISIEWNEQAIDVPVDGIEIVPVPSDDGSQFSQYKVRVSNDGIGDVIVNNKNGVIHFIVPVYDSSNAFVRNDRYRVALDSRKVYQIQSDLRGYTVDFSTSYQYSTLLDNLFINIRQIMMNDSIQAIIDNGNKTEITFADANYNTYVDMFSDIQSLQFHDIGNECQESSIEHMKYAEVFKNHLNEVDSSHMQNGKIWNYMNNKVNSTFDNNGSIKLVDSPSILVKRIGNVDNFTYKVNIDLAIRAPKNLLKGHDEYETKYIIGNAIIKDLECEVTFVPKFNVLGNMTYNVTYKVNGKTNAIAEYNQIIYNYLNKTKTKFLDSKYVTVDVNGTSKTYDNGREISNLTTEVIIDFIQQQSSKLFTDDYVNNLYKEINNKINKSEKEQISIKTIKNQKYEDGIWGFRIDNGKFIDPDIDFKNDENVIQISRGKVYIDGQSYEIKKDDNGVVPGGS